MTEVHLVFAIAVLVLSAVTAIWGTVAWLGSTPSLWFWYALRATQVAVVVQVLLGMLLTTAETDVRSIHYLYGIGALVVSLIAEGMRAGAASRELPDGVDFESLPASDQRAIALRIVKREIATMTIAAYLIFGFAFRAAQVSGHLF